MTERDLHTLKFLAVPAPRPEARARALAAALEAFDTAGKSSNASQASGIASRPMNAPANPKRSWMRARHSYVIAASVAVVTIALPATLYRVNQPPKFEGIAASGNAERMSTVVAALPQVPTQQSIATGYAARSAGAVGEAKVMPGMIMSIPPAPTPLESQVAAAPPAAAASPPDAPRQRASDKLETAKPKALAPAPIVSGLAASSAAAPAAKAKLAASASALSDLQEKDAALAATELRKDGSRRELETGDAKAVVADVADTTPQGWIFTKTGQGMPKWTLEADPTAPSKEPVLKQSGKATYPLALKADTAIADGFVEVKFKAISGTEDRAAGLVWRAKDADNYYVVRANALEDNVVLYKTVAGRRIELDIVGRKGGYGQKVPVPSGQWHTLRVEFAGTRAKVIFNAKPLFEVEDATFKEAGMVGLWTKADSVTAFDSFSFGSK